MQQALNIKRKLIYTGKEGRMVCKPYNCQNKSLQKCCMPGLHLRKKNFLQYGQLCRFPSSLSKIESLWKIAQKKGMKLDDVNKFGESLLHISCRFGNEIATKFLLAKEGCFRPALRSWSYSIVRSSKLWKWKNCNNVA